MKLLTLQATHFRDQTFHKTLEAAEDQNVDEAVENAVVAISACANEVRITPFSYFCSWEIGVFGDGMAKVFTQIRTTPRPRPRRLRSSSRPPPPRCR